MPYKRIVKILLLLAISLQADRISPTTLDVRVFSLPENTLTLHASYNRVNDGLDILKFNKHEGLLDDTTGYDLGVAYGYNTFISFYYHAQLLKINYANSKLNNLQNELFARINLYNSPHYTFDALSFDLGFIHDSADKLDSFATVHLNDSSDSSFYLRSIIGTKLGSSLLNFYAGYKFGSIDSSIDALDVSRDEKAVFAGVDYTLEAGNFIIDADYQYMRLFGRGSGLSLNNHNSIFKLNIARAISQRLLVFIGLNTMSNQFNGLIPYLYNTQTQSDFDQKYAYLRFGFVYNFDLSTLLKK